MPLFEVAILEKPNKKDREAGQCEKLVLPPTPTVAIDKQAAAIAAVMDNPELKVDRARMEVLVRPFG